MKALNRDIHGEVNALGVRTGLKHREDIGTWTKLHHKRPL